MTEKSQSDVFEQDILDAVMQYHLSCDGSWLLEAIRRCGQYGKPIPRIVREPFDEALRRHRQGYARTLDEAFAAQRPKGWNQSGELNRLRHGSAIYYAVEELREAGRPLDEELFSDVAKSFPLSWSTVRNIYREVREFMLEQKARMTEL